MNGILLLLGTNLGDRKANLSKALNELKKEKIQLIKYSSIYESEPWGVTDQPWFYNAVIEISTSLASNELLERCLAIEKRMGRIRKQKWGERLIDIDILYYNSQIISTDSLKVPHPGIPERAFTLFPLAEQWPDLAHPELNKTQEELLKECNSELLVKKTDVVLG